jgi:PAP2 superfamily
MTTPAQRSTFASSLRRTFKITGVLPWVLLAAFTFAAFLHHHSRLPSSYPWTQPLTILRSVAERAWFPTLALGAVLLGLASRFRSDWVGHRVDFLRKLSPAEQRDLVVRTLVGALAGSAVAAFFSPNYVLPDYLCLAGLGIAAANVRRVSASSRRLLTDIVIVSALFVSASYVFTIVKALLFTVGTIEDQSLIDFEEAVFGVALHRPVAAWAAKHTWAAVASDNVYFRLFEHMTLTSLFLVGMGLRRERTRLWCALAICYLLGGPAYYLIPGVGPRFFEADHYEFLRQLPLISNPIQNALFMNTRSIAEGRPLPLQVYSYLACMPSLHMAHEFVLLYYARHSKVFFAVSLVFTAATCVAILVLGWHYSIDILGGALLAAVAIGIVRISRDRLLPRIIFQRGCYLPPRSPKNRRQPPVETPPAA